MNFDVVDRRLLLRRTPKEKEPILSRLSRIEGQVRGLRQMVVEDRYCGDELQQAAAIKAALREVGLIILHDHITAGVELACQGAEHSVDVDEGRAIAVEEAITLLRAVLKQ